MTHYILRHRLRDAFGRIDERTAKDTISFAADYWRLEKIDIAEFRLRADPNFPNHSTRAYPIVHYFGLDIEVLDGKHRIAMARTRGETSVLAWVGHNVPLVHEEPLAFPYLLRAAEP
ncbi:MAG: hypothetical protein ACREFQ_10845 [Stellaceae bacterium]